MGITTSNLEFMHENFLNFVNADEVLHQALRAGEEAFDAWLDADQDDQDE